MAECSGASTTASDFKTKVGSTDDWQTTRPSIRERNAFMFNNPLMSDVTFVVTGSEAEIREVRVPAHKYLLAISSPVFCAMFYGNIAEKNDPIDLPDCHANSFLEFLRYLYSDEIELTAGTVLEVLYLSKKYIVPALSAKCLCFLEKELNIENAFVILMQAFRFDEESLVEGCLEFIDTNAIGCVNSKEMLQIDRNCLVSLLKRDSLQIQELELFKAVQKWAKAKMNEEQTIETIGPEMRKVIGDAIYHFRFTAMSPEDFTEHVVPSQILLEKEIVLIFSAFHSASSKEKLKLFPHCPRLGTAVNFSHLPINRCSRFSETSGYGKLKCRSEWLKFEITASREVLLCGARLYAGVESASTYNAHVELFDGNGLKVLECVNGMFITQRSNMSDTKVTGYGFDVMFIKGSVLTSGLTYSLKVTITALSDAIVRYNQHRSLKSFAKVNGTQWTFHGESPSNILELLFK